jgi:hypothetical protein
MNSFEYLKDLHLGCEGVLVGSGPSLKKSADKIKELQYCGAIICGNNHAMFSEEKLGFSLDYHLIADRMMFNLDPIFNNYLKYNPKNKKLVALYDEVFYLNIAKKYKIKKEDFEKNFIKVPCVKTYTLHGAQTLIPFMINGQINPGWKPMCLTSLESTIQVMLYCGIKKIYLAGVDCSSDGNIFYRYGNENSKDPRNSYKHMKSVWVGIKSYLEKFWPDVEVFSINPVGLKGLFKDL